MLKATTSKSLPASSDTGFKLRVKPFKKLVAEQRTAIINRRQDHGPAAEELAQPQARALIRHETRRSSGSCAPSFWSNPTWLDHAARLLPARPPTRQRRHDTSKADARCTKNDSSCIVMASVLLGVGLAGFGRRQPSVPVFSAGPPLGGKPLTAEDLDRPIDRDMGDPRLAIDPAIAVQAAELLPSSF